MSIPQREKPSRKSKDEVRRMALSQKYGALATRETKIIDEAEEEAAVARR
jgi:hypothetical protein